jgi:hypothetical protein
MYRPICYCLLIVLLSIPAGGLAAGRTTLTPADG